MDDRNFVILVSLIVYMMSCIFIGLWAVKKTSNTRDFFMGGRNIGVMLTGFAVFSSTMSGFGFVGGPGLIYQMGMSSVWVIACTGIGMSLSYFLNGKRLRLFAEYFDTTTLPDAVAHRYRSETTRGLIALAILLGVIGYLATQILAMAMVLESILKPFPSMAGISMTSCVLISSAVLVFYCVTGGIIASIYSDAVQGAVMLVAAVLVFFTAINTFEGGPTAVATTILKDNPESMSAFGSFGIFGCLSWLIIFGLGAAGQPHVISKFMMSRRVEDARSSLLVAFVAFCFSALLWISIGLVMRSGVINGFHPELIDPDAAAPFFLQNYAHPLLAGVVFAALFAAIMSTADSFLNIGAGVLIHDFPQALGKKTLDHELFWARVGTLLLAIVSAVIALYSHYVSGTLIGFLAAFGWSTFAAAIVPVVAIGFNWKKASALAANVAIISSLVVNFLWEVLPFKLPYGISGGAIAILVSLLLFLAISLYGPQEKLPKHLETLLDI